MTRLNALLAFGYFSECIRNADRLLGRWKGCDLRTSFITCHSRNYLKEKVTSLEISVIYIEKNQEPMKISKKWKTSCDGKDFKVKVQVSFEHKWRILEK